MKISLRSIGAQSAIRLLRTGVPIRQPRWLPITRSTDKLRKNCSTGLRLGLQAKRYKGSYSIFARHSQETTAKVVIYEQGKGKANGGLHLRHDVYALIRANGPIGDRNRRILAANGLLTVLSGGGTIGVAPKHQERFYFMRVDDANWDQCLELLRAIACS